ncbi:hypothetical protein ANO11243_051360 [Dothideomycetidae sp. 11243]|nr:hypothetical protein ANO11243_051360 [fungal sp. No.11243]
MSVADICNSRWRCPDPRPRSTPSLDADTQYGNLGSMSKNVSSAKIHGHPRLSLRGPATRSFSVDPRATRKDPIRPLGRLGMLPYELRRTIYQMVAGTRVMYEFTYPLVSRKWREIEGAGTALSSLTLSCRYMRRDVREVIMKFRPTEVCLRFRRRRRAKRVRKWTPFVYLLDLPAIPVASQAVTQLTLHYSTHRADAHWIFLALRRHGIKFVDRAIELKDVIADRENLDWQDQVVYWHSQAGVLVRMRQSTYRSAKGEHFPKGLSVTVVSPAVAPWQWRF